MTNVRALEASRDAESAPLSGQASRQVWLVLAARVMELRGVGVIDDAAFAAVARGLDALRNASPDGDSIDALIEGIERRVEAVLPAELSGVLALAGAREEVTVSVLRLSARSHTLTLLRQLEALRSVLLATAEDHAITLLPAQIGGRPAQPTTFAHYLGGVLAPLATAAVRLRAAYDGANRSPLGASALAGGVIEIDRERLATTLGFEMPIANTFDAVANVEDLVAFAEAAAAAVAPVRRFLNELLHWLRLEPTSFRLGDEWVTQPEPSLPYLTIPRGVEHLTASLADAERAAASLIARLRSLAYAPLGMHADAILDLLDDVGARAA